MSGPSFPGCCWDSLCALLASIVALTIPQVLRVLVNESLKPGGAIRCCLDLGRRHPGPRHGRGGPGGAAPPVRDQPGHHRGNPDAGVPLRPPAGPHRILPRPLGFRPAAVPGHDGPELPAPLDGVRRHHAGGHHPDGDHRHRGDVLHELAAGPDLPGRRRAHHGLQLPVPHPVQQGCPAQPGPGRRPRHHRGGVGSRHPRPEGLRPQPGGPGELQ